MSFKIITTTAVSLAVALSAQGAVSLTHHYTFDTDGADSAGSINGVLQNGASIVAGTIGNAVDVNGSSQHVLMANTGGTGATAVIPVSTSYSVSLWAKRDAASVNGWLFGQGDNGSPRQSLHVGFRNTNQTAHAFWGDDLQWFPSQATDTTNWHQWVVTYDADINEQFMYVDGGGAGNFVSRTTNNGDFLGSGTNNFWVGRRRDGQNFNGQIDDVQVYSGVLSAGNVASLFANPGSVVPEPTPTMLLSILLGVGVVARRCR